MNGVLPFIIITMQVAPYTYGMAYHFKEGTEMALMLSEGFFMKTPGSSNYDTIYWFDKMERKLMKY